MRVGLEHRPYLGKGQRARILGRGMLSQPPDRPLTLLCSSDDSKSSSPEPVTHLKWDDPYYDIARHQIVEVAGEHRPPPGLAPCPPQSALLA